MLGILISRPHRACSALSGEKEEKMRLSTLVVLAVLISGVASAQQSYEVRTATVPPTIDGVRSPGEWDSASVAGSGFELLRTSPPDPDLHGITFQALWDANGLYLIIESEYTGWSGSTGFDGTIGVDCVLTCGPQFNFDLWDLNLDPNRDGEANVDGGTGDDQLDSYQFSFNTYLGDSSIVQGVVTHSGVLMEAKVNQTFGNAGAYAPGKGAADWTMISKTTAVPNADGKGAVIELVFPWSTFGADGGISGAEQGLLHDFAPSPEAEWLVNLAAISSDPLNFLPIWNWNPTVYFAPRPNGIFVAETLPAVYLRSTAGQPWGLSDNEAAMDTAFGVGNWLDERYETVDTASLFSAPRFIYMEGSDFTANQLEAFIGANLSQIRTFIAFGGVVFFNAAPNEGNGMGYPDATGGQSIALNYPDFSLNPIGTTVPTHPIFNGPFPTTTSFTGGAFAHGSLTGAGLTSLLEDSGARIALAENGIGHGLALYGGMTPTDFHGPQPAADNLRANILAYGRSQVFLPEPSLTTALLAGMISLTLRTRKRPACPWKSSGVHSLSR
jgi:hypothetical protein